MVHNQYLKKALVNYDDETLWKMRFYSKEFQDYRDEHRMNWNDNASREVNMRYLDPHERSSESLLEHLKEHYQHLKELDTHVDKINIHSEKIRTLSHRIDENISIVEDDLNEAADSSNRWYEAKGAFVNQVSNVEAVIQQANSLL